MKTANIWVHGHIAVYINYCAVCLEIEYTLRCLEYIYLFSIITIKTPRTLAALASFGLLIVKTLTNVLFNYYV